MQEEPAKEALNKHWQASAAGDPVAEHDIYDEHAVCDNPQSGERILGEKQFAGFAKSSRQAVRWMMEYTITDRGRPTFTVSIMEFRDGKVVHETQYFANPFEAPADGAKGFSGSRDAGLGRIGSLRQG